MDTQTLYHLSPQELFKEFNCSKEGLSLQEAQKRLEFYGTNSLKPQKKARGLLLFLIQFKSPLILLLVAAAIVSFCLGGHTDFAIIMTIVLLSGLLSFYQERGAINALEKLLQLVENKVCVLRDAKEIEVAIEQIVPGDIVLLRAGDLVPADCLLIEVNHFFVNEAMLTGESLPVEKTAHEKGIELAILKYPSALFLGTIVASGSGKALVIATGRKTEYSHIAEKVRFRPPETAFETGVKKFGNFLLEVTFVLVIIIFAVNTYLGKPIVDSFLFSLALAVGLTPQLLPAIISINLSHGAIKMAKKQVVVKRLASIENFGQMDILCTDKTGTLTQSKTFLQEASSAKTSLFGYLNAFFQSGYSNPLDKAILEANTFEVNAYKKIDEIPYDFTRKRISVILTENEKPYLITKGAYLEILAICNFYELPNGTIEPLENHLETLTDYFRIKSEEGCRTLAVAYGTNEEKNLTFLGFLHFFDPIKPGVAEAVLGLKNKGVAVKIITGDHHLVATYVARSIGFTKTTCITGSDLREISDEALLSIATNNDVFAEIEPNQKERLILSLRKAGHVVGFMGDGINDVSALHSADVSIAVESGSDAAKEASDMVLLEKDLQVLSDGIDEGRKTFVNTMKYVYMATSANFGNMFSMAGASLFLSFLPLLPKQVLLTNFLSDFPEMALATDRVDPSAIRGPTKWDLKYIQRFMLIFGLLNAMADYLTFAVLIFVLDADTITFRSAWFVENVISAALIVLVIRTKGLCFRSKPGKLVMLAVFLVCIGTALIPNMPFAHVLGLGKIPGVFYYYLGVILLIFIGSVEIAKHFFFKKFRLKV